MGGLNAGRMLHPLRSERVSYLAEDAIPEGDNRGEQEREMVGACYFIHGGQSCANFVAEEVLTHLSSTRIGVEPRRTSS